MDGKNGSQSGQTLKKDGFAWFQGVESFDYSKNLNILVTGSADHHVRLWNPYVTNKPVAILTGHATGVIGVAIHEGFLQVFSYSKDAVCIGVSRGGECRRRAACTCGTDVRCL